MTPGTKVIALPFEEGKRGVFGAAMKKWYFYKQATILDINLSSAVVEFDIDSAKYHWPTSALKPNTPEQTILQELEQMQTKLNGIIKRLKEGNT